MLESKVAKNEAITSWVRMTLVDTKVEVKY